MQPNSKTLFCQVRTMVRNKTEQATKVAVSKLRSRKRPPLYQALLYNIFTCAKRSLTSKRPLLVMLFITPENVLNPNYFAAAKVSIEALEKAHHAAFAELEESHQKECEELMKRVETAETATAEVQASADELGTRAAALDEMLRASVGSKEEELAGHRSR